MQNQLRRVGAAAVAVLVAAACSESTNPGANTLAAAYASTPAGFSSTTNSFSNDADSGRPFMPEDGHGRGRREEGGRDHGGFGGCGGLMGGGLGRDFLGLVAFGSGRGRGTVQRSSFRTRSR